MLLILQNRPIDVVLSLGTGVPRTEKEELPVFHLQESTFQKLTSPVQNVANLKSLIRLGEINLSQVLVKDESSLQTRSNCFVSDDGDIIIKIGYDER